MSLEREAKRMRAEVDPRDSLVERGKAGWPTHLRNDIPANTLLRELSAHHGAHGNAKIEWWYINAHLSNDVSFFAAFFRLAVSEHIISKTNASCPQASADRLHKVMWAVTDKRTKSYYTVGHCDRKSCDVLLQLIEGGSASGLVQQEPFASGALRESLRDGEMPLPDEVRDGAMSVHPQQNTLQLDFDGNTFAWDEASKSFHLKLSGKAHCQANPSLRPDITVDVTVRPSKPPILHGRDGVVSMGEGDATNDMYYYLFPRCDATGSFTRDGATETVTGRAWVDHEFGGSIAENSAEMRVGLQAAAEDRGVQVGWQWAAVILDNDVEVSLTLLSDSEVTQRFAIIREGTRAAYRVDNIEFGVVEGASWMSPSTARPFPTRWTARIVHPDDGTVSELRFVAVVEDQEFVTIVAKPSFWEGHVTCTGTWRSDATVAGDAYMEVHAQASKQSNDLETYYTLMHTLLVVPAVTALESTKPASKDAAVAIVTGQVEMFSMMVAMQSKSVTPPAGKRALAVTLAAIYWNRAHPEDRAVTTQWVEHVWTTEVKPTMPNDLKRIMLRAWMLKELAASAGDITESSAASEPTPAAAAAIGDDLPFVIPPVTELSKPSPTAFIDTARQLFTCNCKMDRANSGSINVMLGAQGAPLVIRQLADRVVPTLELSVTATGFVTNIKTVVSNHNQVANLDGTTTSWFSVGRGNLVTQACLLDGGRTLYSRTPVPPEAGSVGIEHKWLRAIPASAANEPRNAAGTGSILERYRYDPSGVEGADSITLQRIFRVVA